MNELSGPTLTIGIPAHNEGGNIAALLKELLIQSTHNFTLEKIVIYCDGCTDNTVQQIQQVTDRRVVILEGAERRGIVHGMNEIVREASSDILVLLNADIVVSDTQLIEKLIVPIIAKKADLTAGVLIDIRSEKFFSKVLSVSMEFKQYAFASFRNGKNMYSCVGPVRALSRRLYSGMVFQSNIADDMFSYFYCVSQGYEFHPVFEAIVRYRLPNHTSDYLKQSIRYLRYLDRAREMYGTELFDQHTNIPYAIWLKSALKTFIKYPVYFSSYLILSSYRKVRYWLSQSDQNDRWKMVQSTKIAR